jgi:16S rRNA (guanine966-N2)-methyltransferase
MRIIGGKLAGRHLTSPTDTRLRPTAEHVREGMMELVTPWLAKARLLDLFAGTGALGLEAISRGAARCDFVEFGPGALHALKSNIALLRLREKTRVFKRDGVQFAEALEPGSYDLAFADPPYESKILDRVVASWKARPFAKILVVEHARTHKLPKGSTSRAFVDTTVTLYGG